MYKYAIKKITTDLIDCSTLKERDYVAGDSNFIIYKWSTLFEYSEESQVSIKLSSLPEPLRDKFFEFEHALIKYIKT